MVDHFARIGISQSVLLEDADLKDAWHRAAATNPSEEINHAYAVLRVPAKRIEHLLTLHGQESGSSEKPGATLFDLFLTVAGALKNADEVGAKITEAATALQRAGLTSHLLASLDELTLVYKMIVNAKEHRMTQLGSFASSFPYFSATEWKTLAVLGNDFAFLAKWENEIQKRETRLQETLMGKIG